MEKLNIFLLTFVFFSLVLVSSVKAYNVYDFIYDIATFFSGNATAMRGDIMNNLLDLVFSESTQFSYATCCDSAGNSCSCAMTGCSASNCRSTTSSTTSTSTSCRSIGTWCDWNSQCCSGFCNSNNRCATPTTSSTTQQLSCPAECNRVWGQGGSCKSGCSSSTETDIGQFSCLSGQRCCCIRGTSSTTTSSCQGPDHGMKNGRCLPSCGHGGGTSAICQSTLCLSGTNVESYDCNYCCVPGTSPTSTPTTSTSYIRCCDSAGNSCSCAMTGCLVSNCRSTTSSTTTSPTTTPTIPPGQTPDCAGYCDSPAPSQGCTGVSGVTCSNGNYYCAKNNQCYRSQTDCTNACGGTTNCKRQGEACTRNLDCCNGFSCQSQKCAALKPSCGASGGKCEMGPINCQTYCGGLMNYELREGYDCSPAVGDAWRCCFCFAQTHCTSQNAATVCAGFGSADGCVVGICNQWGTCARSNRPSGTACTSNGGQGTCDGNGKCVLQTSPTTSTSYIRCCDSAGNSCSCAMTGCSASNCRTTTTTSVSSSGLKCSDGTPVGQCSQTKPARCYQKYGSTYFSDDCNGCGCPDDKYCVWWTAQCSPRLADKENCLDDKSTIIKCLGNFLTTYGKGCKLFGHAGDNCPKGNCDYVTVLKIEECKAGCNDATKKCNPGLEQTVTQTTSPPSPSEKCVSGTDEAPLFECLPGKPPKYCTRVGFIDNCGKCGCPANWNCPNIISGQCSPQINNQLVSQSSYQYSISALNPLTIIVPLTPNTLADPIVVSDSAYTDYKVQSQGSVRAITFIWYPEFKVIANSFDVSPS